MTTSVLRTHGLTKRFGANVVSDDTSARGTGYAINGMRSASTNVLLDGSANNDEFDATVGQTASTLIGVEPGRPPVKKFVALGGEPYLIRYNSKLPVVVYAPEGCEVRYRIWKASAEQKPVDKG